MKEHLALLETLSDGRFHSGETLGERLGVTRAAVWKQLRALRKQGLAIHAVRGRGYQLAYPIDLLRVEDIFDQLSNSSRQLIPRIDVFPELDSTNTYLKMHAAKEGLSGTACLAELQSAGRGRQGRTWVSPFGCNLYLSLLWRFDSGPGSLVGLSLVIGVALARALRAHVSRDIGLKWPNDVLWQGQKLAGILVEIAGEAIGPSYAVIGVGINVRMPDASGETIGQPWTDIYRITGRMPSRNALAAFVLEEFTAVLRVFEQHGLPAFLDEWRELDAMAGRTVQLHLPDGVIAGQAQGIDDKGALMILVENELRHFASGEVSLRMSP